MNSTQSLWQHWAKTTPNSCALITASQTINWLQFSDLVERYSGYLHAQGLSHGDILTVVGRNSCELVVAYLASLKLGVLVAMTMPQPPSKLEQKLTTLYRQGQRRFVAFTDTQSEMADLDAQLIELPSLNAIASFECSTSLDRHSEKSDLASIVFTSGSTGNPKAVAHTSEQHIASASGLLAQFEFGSTHSWLLSLPMYHVSGLAIIYRWLVAGATLKVGHQGLESDIKGCTHASLVATQLRRLLDSECPLSLSYVLLGGSHIPNQLALEANQRGIETWIGYGMTEAASTVTAKPVDAHSDAGCVLPNRAIKIDQGRIWIGGDTLASGYYHQGQITPLKNQQGWFDSKDLGRWEGERITIIGRADNQFISGGENIHCEEIESALNKHSAIRQAFVVPVDDKEFGQRPVAIIDCDQLESADVYQAFLLKYLEKFKIPKNYYAMPQLKQEGIKVSRKQLADWLKSKTS